VRISPKKEARTRIAAFSNALNLRYQFYYVTSSLYGMLVRVTPGA